MAESVKHPVIQEIERRKNGDSPQLNLALAIEGGGIRGAVSAGMACALNSSEVSPLVFDAHFGSSGGAFISSYYLSGNPDIGAAMFYEDNIGGEFIDLRQIFLKRRPVLSLDHVLGPVMEQRKPVDFEKIIASQRLRILATKLSDLSRHIFPPPTSVKELKDQLRATASIPAVAGQPVLVGNEYYIDASLNESMPYQAAIDKGFDAVLLLSSRPENLAVSGKNDFLRRFVTTALSRQISEKRQEILEKIAERAPIEKERLAELKKKTIDPTDPPFVYAIHPSRDLPVLGQLEKKRPKIIAGMTAGYLAVKDALDHPTPQQFHTVGEFKGVY